MNEYEITYLADPKLSEGDKDKLDEAIDAAISRAKGEITVSQPPTGSPGSRRRLHYPIQGHRLAWLRMIEANLEPGTVAELRQAIRKQAGILRLSILQTLPRPAISPAIFDSLAQREKREAEQAQPKEEAAPAKPVTMKEVEEKIEQALEEEVK